MAGGVVDAACQAVGSGGGPYGDLKPAYSSETRCSSFVDDRHGGNIVGLGLDVVLVELVSIVKTLLSDTQLSAKICDSGTPHIPEAKLPLHHLLLLPGRVHFLGSFSLSTLQCSLESPSPPQLWLPAVPVVFSGAASSACARSESKLFALGVERLVVAEVVMVVEYH
jgi:hypothetical protein